MRPLIKLMDYASLWTGFGHVAYRRPMLISITGFAILHQAHRYENNSDIGPIAGRGFENAMRLN
jgi:hypothetical protein